MENEKIEVTMGHALRVWWAYLWRAALLNILCFFVFTLISFLFGPILRTLGNTATNIIIACFLTVLFPFTQIFAMKLVLQKRFKAFSIHLVPNSIS